MRECKPGPDETTCTGNNQIKLLDHSRSSVLIRWNDMNELADQQDNNALNSSLLPVHGLSLKDIQLTSPALLPG